MRTSLGGVRMPRIAYRNLIPGPDSSSVSGDRPTRSVIATLAKINR